MDLERDEFVVRYDGSVADESDLIAASEAVGFPAQVVTDSPEAGEDPPFFQEALSLAQREQKPLVLDFTAEWCAPCLRMIDETFPDPMVAPLLDQCVLVKVDTDEHPGLAQKYGVVGLPDIRLLTPDGTEVRRLRDFQAPDAFAGALEDLLATAAAGTADPSEFVDLTDGEAELRDAFNADRGQARLILILSPT